MQISHRVGAKHLNADTMSRLPEPNECPNYRPGVALSDLPCGGCKYVLGHKEIGVSSKKM